MNLIETERLVRKITELLKHHGAEAEARPLAQAYADLSAKVNHRLEQCAAMLAQGDEHQALQLAEAPPPVLELLSRLAFRETNEWREFCRQHDLPVPELPEGRGVRQLNAAYARGISADHALYHDYREAVLLHEDERALKALRSISWRNPNDSNAPRELDRLERKILRSRIETLESALQAHNDDAAVRLVEAIESLDFNTRPAGEVWRRGQQTRCAALLAKARLARTAQSWTETAAHMTELRALLAEHQIELSEPDAQDAAELDRWINQSHQLELEQKRFDRAVLELRQMLTRGEEQQVAGELPGRADLGEQLDALRHKWREIELADRPLGDELPAKVRKLERILESRLEHLNRRRRIIGIAAAATLALAALAVSVILLNRRQARDLASELTALRTARQVTATRNRLDQIRAQQSRTAPSPAVRAAIAASDEFLQVEHQRQQASETALTQLENLALQGFTNLPPDQIQARFDTVQRSIEAVASDYRENLRSRFAASQVKWETWLDDQRTHRAAEFERLLRQTSAAATRDLRYDHGPEAVRATLATLAPELRDLQTRASPPLAALAPPAESQTELKALQQRAETCTAELANWDKVQAAWRSPSSLDVYLESLKTFQRSEFAAPADSRAASDLLGLSLSTSSFLSALLRPAQPDAWAQFQTDPALRLRPDDVMPGERTRLRELRDDENIHSLRVYRRTQRDAPAGDPNRVHTIYLRGQWENTRSALRRGSVYDPQESPNNLVFRLQDYISNIQLDELGRTPEADTFEAIGAKQLLDASGTNYSGTLLGLLDQLNRDEQSNSLFRAWLAWRLMALLELRPAEWGAPWAPALAADRQRLAALGAEGLRSGDWLVPSRQRALAAALDEYFRKARQASYVDQARFLHSLARRTVDTGFALAGHANATADAVVPGTTDDTELWGWSAASRSPALLFRYRKSDNRFVVVAPALPFSPLFRFRGDRQALLAAAKQPFNSAPPATVASLPPFFE